MSESAVSIAFATFLIPWSPAGATSNLISHKEATFCSLVENREQITGICTADVGSRRFLNLQCVRTMARLCRLASADSPLQTRLCRLTGRFPALAKSSWSNTYGSGWIYANRAFQNKLRALSERNLGGPGAYAVWPEIQGWYCWHSWLHPILEEFPAGPSHCSSLVQHHSAQTWEHVLSQQCWYSLFPTSFLPAPQRWEYLQRNWNPCQGAIASSHVHLFILVIEDSLILVDRARVFRKGMSVCRPFVTAMGLSTSALHWGLPLWSAETSWSASMVKLSSSLAWVIAAICMTARYASCCIQLMSIYSFYTHACVKFWQWSWTHSLERRKLCLKHFFVSEVITQYCSVMRPNLQTTLQGLIACIQMDMLRQQGKGFLVL